jgi:dTDP-4-amino-4,6-dideoxygalactose transaminase
MSEAQAAVALMSLEDFPENQKKNEGLFQQYEERLAMIPGLTLVKPAGVSFSNCQYLVCRVDEDAFGLSRNQLVEVLRAENVLARRYFYPGAHRSIPYAQSFPQYLDRLPNTDALCQTCIQFPIGALVSGQDAEVVCDILATAHELAGEVRSPRGK